MLDFLKKEVGEDVIAFFGKKKGVCYYRVFNLSNETHVSKVEEIMTAVINGEWFLLREEVTFTKDGEYLVALKWAEPPDLEKPKPPD